MYSKLTPGKAARPLATTTVAALLAGVVISGCGASSAAAATTTVAGTTATSTTPAASLAAATTAEGAPTAPSAVGTCPSGSGTWPGWQGLYQMGQQLQQEASDEEIDGPGSIQANTDQQGVLFQEMGFSQIEMPQLPDVWAQVIQSQVLSVVGDSSQGQAQAAANAALSLAEQISLLCYTRSAVNPQAPGVLTLPSS